MTTIEMARRLASLNERAESCRAYILALQHKEELQPVEELEAASYLLDNGGDYRISYTCYYDLYNRGYFRADILKLLELVFYEPNIKMLKNRYERNCKLLAKYPYMFRKDFPVFDKLPIQFFPYDDHNGYIPFYRETAAFGQFVNVKEKVISRNFFRDLEKPILASDVYSQYELEYLHDNVRRSEDVARENHIYLHYSDWETFCAWLQVLTIRPLLEDKKVVFLIGEEIEQYPINFQERFGIDYGQYTVQPVRIREITKMIWHTQLSTHNGGDFFNEIFDAHPNLLAIPSIMFDSVEENIEKIRDVLKQARSPRDIMGKLRNMEGRPQLAAELFRLKNPTAKDLLVVVYLCQNEFLEHVDPNARIAPAIFFQPHFHNITYKLWSNLNGNTVLEAENLKQIHNSPIFKEFKYIKTFTPMRRFTTSHGATVKFMYQQAQEAHDEDEDVKTVVSDAVMERILNRSFMIDPNDRLYRDSVLVRFEDGKLNPKATFTALAAFLDLPYTESMTYCSEQGDRDFVTPGNVKGFDPASVYKTYDDYTNDSERYFIEYFLRDAYEYYGYDFHYYDGAEVDEEKVIALIKDFTTINHYIRETWIKIFRAKATVSNKDGSPASPEFAEAVRQELLENYVTEFNKNRLWSAKILMEGLRFVNRSGQPLRMMPRLALDDALLEQPLYH